MPDTISHIGITLVSFLQEEWFWAVIAIIVTLLSFVIQMRKENEISRANFVYNISNDFGNNERILRVYQWLEKCRRENAKVSRYCALQIATDTDIYDENGEQHINFIDIDTYINHFEVVYVILRSVNIKNIDELFQQRFLCFMLNPYIQKEELFACFGPDENDFLLAKKWLSSIYARNKFSGEAFVDYLNTYTCGTFDFSKKALEATQTHWPVTHHGKVRKYLMNYVYYICDPACQYGYYAFSRNQGKEDEERKVMRIIRPSLSDLGEILALQQRILDELSDQDWFVPSSKEELQTALETPQDYLCLQVCNGSKVVAFAYTILNPTVKQDVNVDLKNHALPYADKDQCILDTVFVDPQYRGFGIQRLLIDVLCSWAATRGKRHIAATIHPDNKFSENNFTKSGFSLVTPTPIPKYGLHRNVFSKDLSRKDTQKASDGTYTVYPYV